MFQSATLRLTGWYLAVLMSISIIFSIVIYQINYTEINTRLQNLQQSVIEIAPGIFLRGSGEQDLNIPRIFQANEAARQLFWSLVWVNVAVLIFGGLLSYLLARKSLEPIEKAHEAQSRFTSDASHELRTPLATMKTELEVSLMDPNLDMRDSRELLESNLEEVDKLINITEMLLQLSKLEHESLEKTRLSMSSLFEEKIKSHKKDKNRFIFTPRKNDSIYANKAAISQVISILIDNALTYSPKDSPIQVRVSRQRSMVRFEIKNQGDIIPADQLEKVFNRFHRADKSRTHDSQLHYGLGLSIAKKIVEIHQGEIKAKSDKTGTTFYFSVPAYKK